MQGDRPRQPEREPDRPGADRPAREPQDTAKPSGWEVAERKRRNGLVIRLVMGLILLVLFVIFVSLNSESVPVHFVFFETRTPLVWVFLICALVGGLVAFLLGRSGRRASRKYIKELERRLEGRDKRD
ncbi:MAG: LapA family protein [Actinomycetota bacterium]